MKSRRKGLLLATMLMGPLPALLQSCCDKRPAHDTCRSVTAISLQGYDNTDSVARDVAGPVRAIGFKMDLTLTDSTYVCAAPGPVTTEWMSAAYAIKCVGDGFREQDELLRFEIVSSADFDNAHPAGSDLSGLFYSKGHGSMQTGTHEYYLRSAPSATSSHRIAATYFFTGGKILTDTLGPVVLTP